MAEFVDVLETELYTLLDKYEINGSSKDIEITTHGSWDDESTWTDILVDSQELPAGNYTFQFSWMGEFLTSEEYYWRVKPVSNDGPDLPVTEVKTERQNGRYYFSYFFIYSWDGGIFDFRLQFKSKDAAGLPAYVKFTDYSMSRRT